MPGSYPARRLPASPIGFLEVRKQPLFEKSGAKTSLRWALGLSRTTPKAQSHKVFLLLFVHKK
jgi:hypothetical protein